MNERGIREGKKMIVDTSDMPDGVMTPMEEQNRLLEERARQDWESETCGLPPNSPDRLPEERTRQDWEQEHKCGGPEPRSSKRDDSRGTV